jgi:hypothetical protein
MIEYNYHLFKFKDSKKTESLILKIQGNNIIELIMREIYFYLQ